jgi:hypothetical protein
VRHGDLVASTEGRAFWILDDLSPLKQGAETLAASETKLFAPRDAFLTEWGGSRGGVAGANPPSGAIIYYHLATGTDSTAVKLEILDATNTVVRTLQSKPKPGETAIPGTAGLQRTSWDLRTAALDAPKELSFFGSTSGYLVAPGRYTARLLVGGKSFTAPVTVKQDPRVTLTDAQVAEEQRVMRTIHGRIAGIFRDAKRLDDVRDQVKAIVAHAADLPKSDSVAAAGKQLAASLDSMSVQLVQPKHTNGQDIINFPNGVVDQWAYLAGQVDGSYMPVTSGVTKRLADLESQWAAVQARIDALLGPQVAEFNALLGGKAVVIVPDRSKTTASTSY